MNEAFDAIVLGSGAAGLSAAITARAAGLSVLVLEKTGHFGGSTAVSGGAVWVPGNAGMAALGHRDSRAQVMDYLRAAMGNHLRLDRMEAFLDAAPGAVAFLEAHAGLRLIARAVSPDYLPELPGAMPGGRSMDPAEFDGRRLGPLFDALRPPYDSFLVFGGMMVTRKDIDALLATRRRGGALGHSLRLVGRYARDRLRWGRGTRLVMGNALAGTLLLAAREAGVVLRRHAAVTALDVVDGRVAGVVADGRTVAARAGVVLATGGYGRDPARRASLPHSDVHRSMSPEGNAGDGMRLATEAGAALDEEGVGPAFWAPVSIMHDPDGGETVFPHLVMDRQKPGLMAVGRDGHRFVNEATSYHGFVEGMHRAGAVPAWLVCDARFLREYGLGLVRPGGGRVRRFVEAGYLVSAPDLDGLAAAIGVPAAALQASAAQMNAAAASGVDALFGRGASAYDRYLGDAAHRPNPCLGPIQTAPFHAVQVWPGDIGTARGLRTDVESRVIGVDGRPVAGLFACGNDMASVFAGTYPAAGITLGPALTFGHLAGRAVAAALGRAVPG